jgi:hypothetical protein
MLMQQVVTAMLRSACRAGQGQQQAGQLAKLSAVTGLFLARAWMLGQRLTTMQLGLLRAVRASLLAAVRRLMLPAALQQTLRMSWWLTGGEGRGSEPVQHKM